MGDEATTQQRGAERFSFFMAPTHIQQTQLAVEMLRFCPTAQAPHLRYSSPICSFLSFLLLSLPSMFRFGLLLR